MITRLGEGLVLLARLGGVVGADTVSTTTSAHGDVYLPHARPSGTVMVVHGMSPAGPQDVRLVALCRAVAAAGFRVVAPRFDSIAALRMHVGQIDEIEQAIGRLADDADLCPSGRMAVLSVSFSAGLASIAASRPRVASRVTALCLIGTYGDIPSTLRAYVESDHVTPYGWKIVAANFVETVVSDAEPIRRALLVSALDEWHRREIPELPGTLASLSRRDAGLVRAILDDRAMRRELAEAVLAKRPLFCDFGSVVDHVGGVEAPITLLHGQGDRTIPCEQSRRVHEAALAAGRRSRLLLSPLLTHGDLQWSWRAVVSVPGVAGALGAWIGEAAQASDSGPSALSRARSGASQSASGVASSQSSSALTLAGRSHGLASDLEQAS